MNCVLLVISLKTIVINIIAINMLPTPAFFHTFFKLSVQINLFAENTTILFALDSLGHKAPHKAIFHLD